jgi:poly-gamma-glutamate capsule biosynthesis protein CapA/YwtB (metallophosphatase superfamily)
MIWSLFLFLCCGLLSLEGQGEAPFPEKKETVQSKESGILEIPGIWKTGNPKAGNFEHPHKKPGQSSKDAFMSKNEKPATAPLRLFLCGDVMTGRGIDQVLSHSAPPVLYEQYVKDARRYVDLAERANGDIPQPVSYEYIWGDALRLWDQLRPEWRLINLETSITTSGEHWPLKGIHYRMHPKNVEILRAAGIGYCALANNHVLDWSYSGLSETLQTLDAVGIAHSGAGDNMENASRPAVLEKQERPRVLVFACGMPSSGVPFSWGAHAGKGGVFWLSGPNDPSLERLKSIIGKHRNPGDIVVVSIHWGSNWGYDIPSGRRSFAHRLIDEAGVDLIYGHSSHHPIGMEVYEGRLILYGCGDFLNDYEGIEGHESYRPDLSLMYFPSLDPATGKLFELTMAPMQIRRFQLHRATGEQARWLAGKLSRKSASLGVSIEKGERGFLELKW